MNANAFGIERLSSFASIFVDFIYAIGLKFI